MGKTLVSIVAIAAAVAVNVIPGVGQFLSAAIGAQLAAAATTAITTFGLTRAASLLGIGASGPKPETTESAIKTSRPPRVSAYGGPSRLYGAYILFETATDGTAVDVFAVHEGKIDGIVARYLNDDAVTLTGTSVNVGPDGRYRDNALNFYTTDGSAPGAGLPAISALVPEWQGRGDGVVLLGLTAKAVKAKRFQETYPQSGVPTPSIVARWQLCPDPAVADPLNEAAWTWTENPVRHLLHYKLVREGPRPALPRSHVDYAAELAALRLAWWNRRIAPTLDYWIAAAEACDEPRPLKAGGNEAMYRSCVSHKHIDQHKDTVGKILATFDGWIAPRSDGALIVYAGKYVAPTVAIGPEHIVNYTWDGGDVDDDQAVNEIVCSYVSAAHDYNTVECDPWRDEADITRRGQVLSAPLDAEIPSHAQSRYLAKRKMVRTNAKNRGSVTTNIAGRIAREQRFIDLHIEEAGTVFYSGPAEIVSLTRNIQGGVTFGWVEADPTVDDWNPAAEEGEPATKGDRVAVVGLDAPEIVAASVEFTGSVARLRIEVANPLPTREDLTWLARWRDVGDSEWGGDLEFPEIDAGATIVLTTDLVPTDADLEAQVAYRVGDGRDSPWSDAVAVTTGSITFDDTDVTFDSAAVTFDRT